LRGALIIQRFTGIGYKIVVIIFDKNVTKVIVRWMGTGIFVIDEALYARPPGYERKTVFGHPPAKAAAGRPLFGSIPERIYASCAIMKWNHINWASRYKNTS